MNVVSNAPLTSEDGYELWLRYRRVDDAPLREMYRNAITQVVFPRRIAHAPGRAGRTASRAGRFT